MGDTWETVGVGSETRASPAPEPVCVAPIGLRGRNAPDPGFRFAPPWAGYASPLQGTRHRTSLTQDSASQTSGTSGDGGAGMPMVVATLPAWGARSR